MASKYFFDSSCSFFVSFSRSAKRRSASMYMGSLVISPMLNRCLTSCGAYATCQPVLLSGLVVHGRCPGSDIVPTRTAPLVKPFQLMSDARTCAESDQGAGIRDGGWRWWWRCVVGGGMMEVEVEVEAEWRVEERERERGLGIGLASL